MHDISPELLSEIRARFAHVDTCPFEGERVFFENAGGALTLNSVVETSAKFAAIPDNQGRDNPAAKALQAIIDQSKEDMRVLFGAPKGRSSSAKAGQSFSSASSAQRSSRRRRGAFSARRSNIPPRAALVIAGPRLLASPMSSCRMT